MVFPRTIHFVQVERIAAIYHHYHEWMDRNHLRWDDDTSEEEALPDYGAENANSNLCPSFPWSDGA